MSVLERLLATHAPVRGIVHLRGLDAPGAGGVSVDGLDRWRAHALDSALAAAQAVATHGGGRAPVRGDAWRGERGS